MSGFVGNDRPKLSIYAEKELAAAVPKLTIKGHFLTGASDPILAVNSTLLQPVRLAPLGQKRPKKRRTPVPFKPRRKK